MHAFTFHFQLLCTYDMDQCLYGCIVTHFSISLLAAQVSDDVAEVMANTEKPEGRARSASPLAPHRESQEFREEELAKVRQVAEKMDSPRVPGIAVEVASEETVQTQQDESLRDEPTEDPTQTQNTTAIGPSDQTDQTDQTPGNTMVSMSRSSNHDLMYQHK